MGDAELYGRFLDSGFRRKDGWDGTPSPGPSRPSGSCQDDTGWATLSFADVSWIPAFAGKTGGGQGRARATRPYAMGVVWRRRVARGLCLRRLTLRAHFSCLLAKAVSRFVRPYGDGLTRSVGSGVGASFEAKTVVMHH